MYIILPATMGTPSRALKSTISYNDHHTTLFHHASMWFSLQQAYVST
jgi:hypothetical protein